jgi:hypothetical protein
MPIKSLRSYYEGRDGVVAKEGWSGRVPSRHPPSQLTVNRAPPAKQFQGLLVADVTGDASSTYPFTDPRDARFLAHASVARAESTASGTWFLRRSGSRPSEQENSEVFTHLRRDGVRSEVAVLSGMRRARCLRLDGSWKAGLAGLNPSSAESSARTSRLLRGARERGSGFRPSV